MAKKITWSLIDVKASDIKPNPNNPKYRDDKGFSRLQKSLQKFGTVFDGIINKDHTLIDGHSRLELADPDSTLKVFIPSRKLSEKEYSEMNAIFDLAKAGEIDHSILEENFGEEFFTEWELTQDRKEEMEPAEPSQMWFLNIELGNEKQTEKLFKEMTGRGFKVKIVQ